MIRQKFFFLIEKENWISLDGETLLKGNIVPQTKVISFQKALKCLKIKTNPTIILKLQLAIEITWILLCASLLPVRSKAPRSHLTSVGHKTPFYTLNLGCSVSGMLLPHRFPSWSNPESPAPHHPPKPAQFLRQPDLLMFFFFFLIKNQTILFYVIQDFMDLISHDQIHGTLVSSQTEDTV